MTAALRRQPEPYDISTAEILRRTDGMRHAIASAAIEGGKVNDDTKALMERFAIGEITEDEMIAATLENYGPRA